MNKKLYHHKTNGGAEYLMDTFIAWTHNGKKGKEGTVNEKTRILIRLDGKTPEIIHNDPAPELLEALQSALIELTFIRDHCSVKTDKGDYIDVDDNLLNGKIREAITKATA